MLRFLKTIIFVLRRLRFDIARSIKLRYWYPFSFPGSSIESLLPAHLEKNIQPGTIIEPAVSIPSTLMSIGKYTYIGSGTIFYTCTSVGAFCSISRDVKIGLTSHPLKRLSTSPAFYATRRGLTERELYDETQGVTVVIENDVLISANAMILNGVTIGHGAVVGAGAFVNKDVPPFAIVAGVPAKIIGYRFDETIHERILLSEWWKASTVSLAAAAPYADPLECLQQIVDAQKIEQSENSKNAAC